MRLLQAVSPWEEGIVHQGLHQLVAAEFLYQRGGAAAGHLHVQACAHPGRGLSVVVAEHPPAVPSAHCPGVGGPVPGDRRDATRAGRPALHRGGLHRAGGGLLAAGGQHASERSANVEAISHCTTGIELLKTLPETPERTKQALTLHIALGAALLMAKGHWERPRWSTPIPRHARCVSRWARHQSWSRSCLVCTGFM